MGKMSTAFYSRANGESGNSITSSSGGDALFTTQMGRYQGPVLNSILRTVFSSGHIFLSKSRGEDLIL